MDGPVDAAPEGPAVADDQPQNPRDITPLVGELRGICGDEWVYTAEHQLRTYESDGLLQYHATPAAAVLPSGAAEVQAVVQACARHEVPWVARGAGSGLSGGVLGKMISPQNLAIGASAVGLAGKEGDLFRRVIGWSLLLLLIMCVLVYLQSTSVLSWMVP